MLIQCSKIFNKLLVKLIEIFIILFSGCTVFPIYNQEDAQNTTLNMKKNLLHPQFKRFHCLLDAALPYLYKHLQHFSKHKGSKCSAALWGATFSS